MSINVTVSGNPVCIKKGKMVTGDPYNTKKDFDKRRLLRLEQVRQQSKELAEDVRNKVRKERKKQISEIEKEGKEKLKNWQNRKLLELQNQYQDALEEIGTGHKEAENLENENELIEKETKKNKEAAQNRGRIAQAHLQVQKNKENYKKAMPVQHKKFVRDVENTRAALVSSVKKKSKVLQKKTKKPKASADINITIPDYSSDFSEEMSSEPSKPMPSIRENDSEDSEGFCNSPNLVKENTASGRDEPKGQMQTERSKTSAESKSFKDSMEERRTIIENFKNRPKDVCLDTRISDRIKRRQILASQPDFCDYAAKPTPMPEIEESSKIRERIVSRPNYEEANVGNKELLEVSSDECACIRLHNTCPCKSKTSTSVQVDKSTAVQTNSCRKCTCGCTKCFNEVQEKQTGSKITEQNSRIGTVDSEANFSKALPKTAEIPSKPAVKLKNANAQTVHSTATSGAYRVRQYDHLNRFESNQPSTSHIEKVTADSVEAIPNSSSELEWLEKMQQRDKEAHLRGKKALEKEKIQRDYKEMMKKLPILQRKEHITQIGTDKPEYHMSEERLKNRERQRQNRLENAFNQAAPEFRPQIVTIPSRTHSIPKTNEPFEILDGDDSRTLNLGKWDAPSKPKTMFSAEEVQEIIKAFTMQKPEDRKTKLKQLLKSLKLQKEQLLNEIRSLPKDDSINALISDLNSFSDGDERQQGKKKKEKKRRREESDTSNTSSELTVLEKNKQKSKHEKSPLKKLKKSKPKVLILQNTSTQTTPKPTKEKSPAEVDGPVESDSKICTKTHVPCDCAQSKAKSSEEVCKIFIKLNEDESPKVEVVRSAREKNGVSERAQGQTNEIKKGTRQTSPDKRSASPIKEKRSSKSPDKEKRNNTESTAKHTVTKPVETKTVATETEPVRRNLPTVSKRIQPAVPSVGESWKEQLSKNSMSTSSTSYLSPPEFSRPNTTASTDASKASFYNLRKKPQQTNVNRSSVSKTSRQTPDQSSFIQNKRLLNYVKRLLSMSKLSLDDLGVSSSDVQTPSQSVIEMDSNNPLAPLHNIIKLINLKAADIAKELSSVSADESRVPYNSFATSTNESLDKGQQDLNESQHIPERDNIESSQSRSKEAVVSQFADVTDSCSRRIANLAAMIEKLREEKIQMLQSPPISQNSANQRCAGPCDKDNSTRYLDLPHSASGEKSKGTNSTASLEEEELNRRLLEVDMSLAEKLKQFRQRGEDKSDHSSAGSNKSGQEGDQPMSSLPQEEPLLDQPDQDFLRRLQRLIEENHETDNAQNTPATTSKTADVPFVPLLLDIPKLPILEPQPEISPASEKRHPPPSKGLIVAKRFNGNISLVPHELSTIAEADSQVSTKVSPNNSKTCAGACNTEKSLQTDLSLTKASVDQPATPPIETTEKSESKHQSDDETFKEKDLPDLPKSLPCSESTCTSICLSSSSSSSDLASFEAMLKTIGMDWIIPTLHKTQEALALSSSSSSAELTSKKKITFKSNSSSSEVSLKEFLKRQMMSKISSSSLNKSEASPGSFVKECSEWSAIQANSSGEKTKQRTSTPVLSSKSTSKSKDEQQPLFTGASDISSVRNTSCDASCAKSSEKQSFHSLGDGEQSSVTGASSSG